MESLLSGYLQVSPNPRELEVSSHSKPAGSQPGSSRLLKGLASPILLLCTHYGAEHHLDTEDLWLALTSSPYPSPRPGRGALAPSARRRARRGASPRAGWARSIAPACGPGRRRQGHQRARAAWTPTSCDHVVHGAGQPTPLRGRWPARRPSAPSTTATGRTPGAPRRPSPGAWAPPSGARGEGLVKRPGHLKSFTRHSLRLWPPPSPAHPPRPRKLLAASAAPWRRCTAAPPPRRPAPRAAPRSAREGSKAQCSARVLMALSQSPK